MTDDHLSLDELAELDEGLLPPERTSAIRAHLHGCAQCQARADGITATREMLAGLPPVRMPADVRDRLNDALGAEAAEPPAPTEPSAPSERPGLRDAAPQDRPVRSLDVVPAPGTVSRPRFGRPTVAASAAAAVVVLAIGAIVVGALNHHNHPSVTGTELNSASSASGGTIATTPSAHFFQTSTGRNYTVANLAPDIQGLIVRAPRAVPSPATTGSTGSRPAGTTGNAADGGAAGTAAGTGTAGQGSGRSGRPLHGGKPATVLSRSPSPGPSTATLDSLDQQPVPKAMQALAGSRAKILACAAVLTGSHNAVPIAVDFGRWTNSSYRRSPSAVFVFRTTDPAKVAVYVVGPVCNNGIVYDFAQVPLPE